ncbi:MAG: hypothetical protein Q8S18_02350 [Bacteroidales bacterium]|nr:hypothetical protein [Bacteroidales bacterium]
MKTTSKILILLLAILAVSPGCKKLLDVTFDAKFVASFPVGPTSNLKNFSFNETYTIDPETNSDYKEYADKIKDVKIKSVTGKVTSINTPVTLTNTSVTATKEGFTTVAFFVASMDIFEGFTYTYTNEDAQFNNLAKMLKNTEPLTVTLNGTASEEGVVFTYEVTFDTEITANPLE